MFWLRNKSNGICCAFRRRLNNNNNNSNLPTAISYHSSTRRFLSSDNGGSIDRQSQRKKPTKQDYDYCIDLVQSRDRESYLCGLLMPEKSRKAYFAIRAFNVELASIKDGSISRQVLGTLHENSDEAGSLMALKVRISWWYNTLDQIYNNNHSPAGAAAASKRTENEDPVMGGGGGGGFEASIMASSSWNNPIVRALDDSVHKFGLTRRFLERLIEAREQDLDVKQHETIEDAINYAENVASSLLYLSLETTNTRDDPADLVAYHAGIGIGLSLALRGARLRLLGREECAIPKELISSKFPYYKLNTDDPISALTEDERIMMKDAVYEMAQLAMGHFNQARELQSNVPKIARPCFLPVVPSSQFLMDLEKVGYDVFDDELLNSPNQLKNIALIGRTWLTGIF